MTRDQTIHHLRRRAEAIRSGRSIETRAFVGDAIDTYLDSLSAATPLDAFGNAPRLTPMCGDMVVDMQNVLAVRDALCECERELARAEG